jgi:ABC-2 type transport system permease protein
MTATLSIAKREFRSYFDSPVAYVVVCIGLLALGLFFFNYGGGFWQANRASLQQMFSFVPYGLSLLVVPVVTMRLLAEEKRSGTLEMLITLPVKDRDVILGKYLGAMGLVSVLLLSTVLYPLMMFEVPWDLGAIDTGPVITAYVGLFLFSAAAVSIGLLISSLTDSQIIAFFITFFVLVLLQFIGSRLTLDVLPESLELAASFIGFDARLEGFFRGMVNTRDVFYFVSITIGCLIASFWALERRKWA